MSEYEWPEHPEYEGEPWPACSTPDCDRHVCLWGGTGLCHPCSVRLVGKAEMDRRYAATRVSETDLRWNGTHA